MLVRRKPLAETHKPLLGGLKDLKGIGAAIQMSPGDHVCQLCGLVKDDHIIVQRQMDVRQAPIILRRLLKWQFICVTVRCSVRKERGFVI